MNRNAYAEGKHYDFCGMPGRYQSKCCCDEYAAEKYQCLYDNVLCELEARQELWENYSAPEPTRANSIWFTPNFLQEDEDVRWIPAATSELNDPRHDERSEGEEMDMDVFPTDEFQGVSYAFSRYN